MKRIILKILRFLPVFVLPILLCLLNRSSFTYMNEAADHFIPDAAANIILAVSNAVLYGFLLNNAIEHDINSDTDIIKTSPVICVLKNPGFYISTFFLIFYDLIFSSSMSNRLSDTLNIKPIGVIISLAVIIFMSLLLWCTGIKSRLALVEPKKIKPIKVILGYFIPSVAISMIVYFIPFIAVQINVILFIGRFVLIGLAIALIVYFTVIYSKAITARKAFLIKLKEICKEKGYVLSEIHNPYKSIFRDDGKISYTIQHKNNITEHKLMSCLNKATNVFLFEEGGVIKDLPVKLGKRAVLFSFRNKTMIDSQNCCVIFTSSPNNAVNGTADGKEYIDNNSKVGKLTYFTSTGYLNTLERNQLSGSVRLK